ncbi:MAG: hypothetical protein IH597_16730 [Bacteroidales bacterium]|nr:hypothetical protein [Bacteroidales bacterium]
MIIVLPFTSCSRKIVFQNSSVVPAAQGTVKVKNDKNKNYVIKVEVSDLADVSRLQPPKKTYVVWMETDQGKTENLGQLLSSSGFMSKQLKGSLETVSSFKPAKIYITAEDDASIQYPGRQLILSTTSF